MGPVAQSGCGAGGSAGVAGAVTVRGNPEGVPFPWFMTLSTADISIQLLMDTTAAL